VNDEGVLDPFVKQWMEENPLHATPLEEFPPELRELARGDFDIPPTREIAHVDHDVIGDVPVRIYRPEGTPTGVVVYIHGGGFVIGSIGIMDNVAREIAHASGAVVVSVGYRLAPENPFPAGLDDCEAVTRWAFANAAKFGAAKAGGAKVAVAGESAGGNLSAAVALRLRAAGDLALAGQVLIYPGAAGGREFPSAVEFDGLVISRKSRAYYWEAYSGDNNIDDDPFAAPLTAPDLTGLPPALVILGGCDLLRDEGRAYAARMRADGVDVEEVCYPGQPHGFVNFMLPAATAAFERIGAWLRGVFA
jgi:acetyl esterase